MLFGLYADNDYHILEIYKCTWDWKKREVDTTLAQAHQRHLHD